jgi:hypothetical protein
MKYGCKAYPVCVGSYFIDSIFRSHVPTHRAWERYNDTTHSFSVQHSRVLQLLANGFPHHINQRLTLGKLA